jgi:hypothetical protein
MADDDKNDNVKRDATPDNDGEMRYIQRMAGACLEHVRAVRWGAATSSYQTNDKGLEIHVSIKVECHSKAKEKDSK